MAVTTLPDDRVESWKQIAAYLKRDIRTVQRWERTEGLPVHRHRHQKLSSVYAFKSELDRWQSGSRATILAETQGTLKADGRSSRFSRLIWAFSALLLFLVAATTVIYKVRGGGSRGDEESRVIPFTTYLGGEYEPKFSPDGKWVAFIWNKEKESVSHIYIKSVRSGELRRVTMGDGSEASPAWSPDGSYLAFLRLRVAPPESEVYIAPVFGGPERKVTSLWPLEHVFHRHLDWSPDGKFLAVADKVSGPGAFSIFLVSPETGTRRQLTNPSGMALGDVGPAFSPDGKSLAFLRSAGGNLNEIYVQHLDRGDAQRLTFDNSYISDEGWSSDGRAIVFSSGRSGSVDLWEIPANGGRARHLRRAADDAYFLTISKTDNLLAFSRWFADTNIWRVEPVAGHPEQRKLTQLIASTLEERSAQYSPDGTRIAFRSNRSGSNEIWISGSSGEKQTQLTSFNGPLTGTPRWSPDGGSIAFDSRPRGFSDIYVISSDGGAPRRVTSSSADDVVPSWSVDGKWLYFGSNRSGTWEIWRVAAQGESAQAPAVQITKQGGFAAFEGEDGKWLYYAKGRDVPGLWRVAVAGGEETPVIPDLRAGYWGYWTLDRNNIYFLEPEASGRSALKRYSLTTGKIGLVATISIQPPFGDSGLSVTRDGREFLYNQVDHSSSDILLAKNFF